jgi:hypothetical protein
MFGAAQHVRLLKDGAEHRGEIAGRGVDDAEDFCRRDLLSKRLVTFGFEFVAALASASCRSRSPMICRRLADVLPGVGLILRPRQVCFPEGSYPDR